MELENTPKQIALRLLENIRDMGDDMADLINEVTYLTEALEIVFTDPRLESLVYTLDRLVDNMPELNIEE